MTPWSWAEDGSLARTQLQPIRKQALIVLKFSAIGVTLKYCEILAYPAINTVGDCSKASYVISAWQTIKDKAKNTEPQKPTFTVGEIYWTCDDLSGGWERPVWAILLNCISFHSTLQVARNSLLHFFTSHVVRAFFSYFVSLHAPRFVSQYVCPYETKWHL